MRKKSMVTQICVLDLQILANIIILILKKLAPIFITMLQPLVRFLCCYQGRIAQIRRPPRSPRSLPGRFWSAQTCTVESDQIGRDQSQKHRLNHCQKLRPSRMRVCSTLTFTLDRDVTNQGKLLYLDKIRHDNRY